MGVILVLVGVGFYFMCVWCLKLVRDYDIFFAVIGLLFGGILIF